MSLAIFGYGSLLNRKSAENALKRALSTQDMIPALLKDHVRRWRAKEDIWFDHINAQATGIFLDLEHYEGKHVNGVLIHVTPSELDQLKLREKNYDCVDVSEYVDTDLQVFTFVAQENHRLHGVGHHAYVPLEYIKLVEEGCMALGEDFLNAYRATTEDTASLMVMPGPYRFVDPVQAMYI